MEQQAIIHIHHLAAGLTVSVMPAHRMAPISSSAHREHVCLGQYLEPLVAPLIEAKFPFIEIATCVKGTLLKLAREEVIISHVLLTEEEAIATRIEKGTVTAFPEDR